MLPLSFESISSSFSCTNSSLVISLSLSSSSTSSSSFFSKILSLSVRFLSIINTFIALITFPLSIPLYFDKNTDKIDKLFFDLSTLVGTIVCVSITLASYQILQQYGLIGLPEFYPFGNLFSIHNFVY